jgi:hypothetical protein
MTPDTIEFEIQNGPSRMNLMLAVFDREQGEGLRKVKFQLLEKQQHLRFVSDVYVHGAVLEISPFRLPDDYTITGTMLYDGDWEFFRGEYNCSRREGTLTVLLNGNNEENESEKLELERAKSNQFLEIIFRMAHFHQESDEKQFFQNFEYAKSIRDAKEIEEIDEIVKEMKIKK